ncbi:MAG: hypothetical protein QM572_01325, partial [Nocardioides sp.]|uniref:hypothetical protein n=1 Tax=Nocardioides sp. TaxID=35761 RepID=UPI0039E56BDD
MQRASRLAVGLVLVASSLMIMAPVAPASAASAPAYDLDGTCLRLRVTNDGATPSESTYVGVNGSTYTATATAAT